VAQVTSMVFVVDPRCSGQQFWFVTTKTDERALRKLERIFKLYLASCS
jgi:hypothetical protein